MDYDYIIKRIRLLASHAVEVANKHKGKLKELEYKSEAVGLLKAAEIVQQELLKVD